MLKTLRGLNIPVSDVGWAIVAAVGFNKMDRSGFSVVGVESVGFVGFDVVGLGVTLTRLRSLIPGNKL